jgi:hypothetical protein
MLSPMSHHEEREREKKEEKKPFFSGKKLQTENQFFCNRIYHESKYDRFKPHTKKTRRASAYLLGTC